jgi:hypothetical protein
MANAINRLSLPHFNCMTHVTDTHAKYARKRKPHLAPVQRSLVGFTGPAKARASHQAVSAGPVAQGRPDAGAAPGEWPRLDLEDHRIGIPLRNDEDHVCTRSAQPPRVPVDQ